MVSSSPLRTKTLACSARWRLGKTTWFAFDTHECDTNENVGNTACDGDIEHCQIKSCTISDQLGDLFIDLGRSKTQDNMIETDRMDLGQSPLKRAVHSGGKQRMATATGSISGSGNW